MSTRLFRLLTWIGLLALLLGQLPLAQPAAARPRPATPPRPVQPAPAHPIRLFSAGLSYYGGPVMAQQQHMYTIYWGTSFSPSYQPLIHDFFVNVGADSGKSSNVFYNATQYYSSVNGWNLFAAYNQQLAGTWSDTTLPLSGCTNTTLGTLRCYTDMQVRDEVTHAIQVNGWPTGPSTIFFVFLGAGISTCSGPDCAGNEFCAYHVHYSYNGQTLRYANMPYFNTDPWDLCRSGQAPNGDVVADRTLNLLSRVESDIVTDPLGNSWVAASIHPKEVGDLCFQQFGPPLGGQPGSYYNQVINEHHYWLQEEWSNWSNNCVLTGW